MGVEVKKGKKGSGKERQAFMKRLLRDVRALEMLLETDRVERGVRRIGAEQELFILDQSMGPTPLATELLATIDDPLYEHELGLYNLEFSVDPVVFGDHALSQVEAQLNHLLDKGRAAAAKHDASLIMTGILPTIDKSDLGLHNQTPNPRYRLLNDTLSELRGQDYEINIRGIDEMLLRHDDVMLESANTSFQVHFQVAPEEFARLYNIAQAVCAPVLSAATNSPLLFGKRLWRETRIALFQQSVDTRSTGRHLRELQPRVSFGSDWVKESVLEIFREDISRFRVLFAVELDAEDPMETVARGSCPNLGALRMHNSTIYRWNRPCYGVSPDGKLAHLRIENRVLPSGPTPLDEVANAAFWFGLMSGVLEEYGDITQFMEFDVARANFVNAAQNGLTAPITWADGKTHTAQQLILEQLLPLAREGLQESGIHNDDIARYLGVIAQRTERMKTGSDWTLRAFSKIKNTGTRAEVLSHITASTLRNQRDNIPVHEWEDIDDINHESWRDNHLRVSQYMSRDLITLEQDEPIEFAASLMTWHHVHWLPVEDQEHNLVGLVTHDLLLGLFANKADHPNLEEMTISQIMLRDITSIPPDTLTSEALTIMYDQQLSCLPVVEDGKLVGLLTEHDVMELARNLLEDKLQ